MDHVRSGHEYLEPERKASLPKMRKRTKSGCLTCRKRRIKCGEETPVCRNCVQSKRQCEGYNQRVVFKQPIGDWPNHPGVLSQYSYHSSMLPVARVVGYAPPENQDNALTSIRPRPLTSFDFYNEENGTTLFPWQETSPAVYGQPWSGASSTHTAKWTRASDDNTRHMFPNGNTITVFPESEASLVDPLQAYCSSQCDVVEYLDEDYYDLESDDDSAICLTDDAWGTVKLTQDGKHPIIISEGALDRYRPQYTANPIKDSRMAQAFAYYLNYTGPSLAAFGMDYDDRLWRVSLPKLAMHNLGLLHAVLALSTLQVAHIYGRSTTPSMKHYAYSLKRIHRAVARPDARNEPGTLATVLLLGLYELITGDFTKWSAHLTGLAHLLRELKASELRDEDSELSIDILWSYAKQDTYHSILSGTGLIMDPHVWLKLAPRTTIHSVHGLQGNFDHLLLILGRTVQSAIQFRKRITALAKIKPEERDVKSIMEEAPHKAALSDWLNIRSELENFISLLGPTRQPLAEAYAPRVMSPFGPATSYRSHSIATLWTQIYMARMILNRNYPEILDKRVSEINAEARLDALAIGKTLAIIMPAINSGPTSPAIQELLVDCTMPLFVAAAQYQDHAARIWTVDTFETIKRCTGWQFATQASLAVQQIWVRVAEMGRGPPWPRGKWNSDSKNDQLFLRSKLAELGKYWLVVGDYEAQELLLPDGDSQISERTAALQSRNVASETLTVKRQGNTTMLADPGNGEKRFRTTALGSPHESTPSVRYNDEELNYINGELNKYKLSRRSLYEPGFDSAIFMDLDFEPPASPGWFEMKESFKTISRSGDSSRSGSPEYMPVNHRQSRSKSKARTLGTVAATAGLGALAYASGRKNKTLNATVIEDRTISSEMSTKMSSVQGPVVDTMEKMEVTSPLSDIVSSDQSIIESEMSMSIEEDSEEPSLLTERRRVVDRVMEYFYTIFRAMPTVTQRGNSDSQNRSFPSTQDVSTGTPCFTHGLEGASRAKACKRRREKDDDEDSDDEDGDRSPKRPRSGKERVEPNQKRKFACPYFKRDSERYLSRRSCVGPGWDEVRRVKEHLYRNHVMPIFCRRCYRIFKAETLLDDHQRAVEPCTMRPKETIEGFDKLQHERLRSRKKSQPEPSEEDKWRDVYRILFPGDDEALMPSPYLDADWQKMYQKGKPSASNELARYEQFLRRELPPAVRRELESAVEREFSPLEERLKTHLIDIVRDLQLQLFQSYTRTRRGATDIALAPEPTPTPAAAPSLPEDSVSSHTEISPTANADLENISLENQLAAYEPAPPLEESSVLDFEAVLFQFDDFGQLEDSAYGSMFAESSFSKGGWDDGSGYCYDPKYDNGEGPSGV